MTRPTKPARNLVRAVSNPDLRPLPDYSFDDIMMCRSPVISEVDCAPGPPQPSHADGSLRITVGYGGSARGQARDL